MNIPSYVNRPPISSAVCAKVELHTQIPQGTVYVTGDNRRKHKLRFEHSMKGNSGVEKIKVSWILSGVVGEPLTVWRPRWKASIQIYIL